MKRTLTVIVAALFAAVALFAQTPEEIIARMDQEVDRFDAEGFSMVMEIKLPLLGTFSSTIRMLGDKCKSYIDAKGEVAITWWDADTKWEYEASKNEITITPTQEDSDAEKNVKSLSGVTEGYDVKLTKETADAWYFRCTKSKSNPKKDDPKKMDLVVSKTTYLPISNSISEKGVKVTLRDFVLGVSEEEVTFNPADYPNATIIDKR